MKLFKNPADNTVWAYEADGSQDAFISPSFIPITEEEANELRKPAPLTGNDLILSQIADIEVTITQRRLREAALNTDNGWLLEKDAAIAALRAQIKK